MKDVIKRLQDFQLIATDKGISYDLDVNMMDTDVSSVEVKMYYTVAGEILDNRNFRTSISADDRFTSFKLKRIEKFINNVEESK